MIQFRREGVKYSPFPGWYWGTVHCGELSAAAVGPFDKAEEACMDLTRAFVLADALGPVEERDDG